ncbi:MAG: hypothetical protein JOZ96_26540 [Acidobacteria bacterium]|nr:hypothetical protein [Acidobacteriota bacterium]
MKTFTLIILPALLLVALLVLYLRRASGRSREQGKLYESLAARFGLSVFTPKTAAGLAMWPELGGVYRGREVRVRGGVEFDPRLGEYDRLFRGLSGASGPRLREVRQGEFTYLEVKCANPSRLAFYVAFDKSGPQGGAEFDRHFRVKFGEGGDLLGGMVLTEALRRELLSTVTAKCLHPFEKLALVGDALLYIETGRLKTADQAERFARMIDGLCDAADVADATPRPLRGVASHVTAPD